MGRLRRDPPARAPAFTDAQRALLAASAAVDQVLTLVEQAMRANTANRPLVDLALDVQATLRRAGFD